MRSIEINAAPSDADRDVAVLGVYRFGAWSSVVAGLFGLCMARVEEISRPQRLVARVAALGTAGLGVLALQAPVPVTKLLRRRLSPWALPALGLAGIATSGGDRSPVLYPALMLTALGGGRLGSTRVRGGGRSAGVVLGAAAAGGYLCVVAGARRPWRRGWERGLLWNVGIAPIFFANALLGGELGDLALSVRCVERTRVRDRAALDAARRDGQGGLRRVAETIGEVASELEQTLLGHAARNRLRDDAASLEVGRAVEQMRGSIKHHLLVPLLVAAANAEPRDLASSLEAMLAIYRDGWREQGISIPLDCSLPPGLTLDAHVTSILVGVAQVALDNSIKHQRTPLTRIEVELRLNAGRVVLRIADDGGCTHAPLPTDWGTGLSETLAEVSALGGSSSLRTTGQGLELCASVPLSATAAGALAAYTSVSDRIDEALARCTPVMRSVTWFSGTACLLTARRPRSGAVHVLLFSGLAAADRLWYRYAPEDRRRAIAILPAIGLLWPAGGRPATGWIGLELLAQGARGSSGGAALAALALASAATVASARRVRGTLTRGRLAENVAFPLVCALSGLAAAAGRGSLERAEREVLGLRERAELIERLAGAVKLRHAVIKPLRGTEGWYERGIMESAEGQRLLSLSERVDVLTAELLGLIAVPDPIGDIQEHLRLRLDPVTVTVGGECPASAPRSDREPAVKRAREHLAALALADELANQLLARFPPSLNGRSRLQSVHLDIGPLDERELRVTVRPLSEGAAGRHDLAGLAAMLAGMSGRLLEAFEAGGFSFAIPATVLVAR